MSFRLKIFFITPFTACVLILAPVGGISAADENVSEDKTPISIDHEKTEVVSVAEKNKKKRMEEQQRKELLKKIDSRITANNKSYRLIYMGIFFAVLIYAFLTLCSKEAKTHKKIFEKRDK